MTTAVPFRGARRTADADRPLAAALRLDDAHVDTIERSHERCASIGLSRLQRPDFAPQGRADLAVTRERNRRLHLHALPVMEMLLEQIANTQSMVVLTDACGTILHSVGDDDFLARASKVALVPGVDWSESAKGTNAIGTALVSELPTLVYADEHFMHANHFLSCSAAPILDPRGNMLGVIDVTGDHRRYHQHTMGLVRMSARMIENHWLTDDCRHVMRVQLHRRAEFLGTLMEGLIAVDADGRIVGANRSALEQLGLSSVAVRRHGVTSLFGISVGSLADHFRSPLAAPLALRLPDGSVCHVRALSNGAEGIAARAAVLAATPPALQAAPVAVPVPVAAPAPAAALAPVAAVPAVPVVAMPAAPAAMVPAAPVAVMPAAPAAAAVAASAVATPRVASTPRGLRALDSGDASWRAVLERLHKLLGRELPILLLGETGTGKELLARAFHADSARAARPFVAVGCAVLSVAELDAALAAAQGGTLFLDDVGELPPPAQARLLRLLQAREGARGGDAGRCDVALLGAARQDPRALREELYHRLAGATLRLPPLRERSDLAALAQRLLAAEAGATARHLSAEALRRLRAHPWPGNVRQLANVLRAAALVADGCTEIDADHLGEDFAPPPAAEAAPALPRGTLEDAELALIRAAVEAAGGNISAASKRLGIARNTIYRRLRWNAGH